MLLLVKNINFHLQLIGCFGCAYASYLFVSLLGHSYAMGGILGISHDLHVMRSDRGWFCLPEIFLKMRFPEALVDLIRYM